MGQSKTRTSGIYTEVDGSKTINKTYKGERFNKRLGKVSQEEAEACLHRKINAKNQAIERTKSPRFLFADCAERYLNESLDKPSIESIAIHINHLLPFIGTLVIENIHDGTLQSFINKRKSDSVSPTTVNRSLEVVSTILNQAARVYRDQNGQPWLKQMPPKITKLKENRRKPRPIDHKEQAVLISELPAHLKPMVIFAVNTGLRSENVCGLKWQWEKFIPELERSVFIIPAEVHKTGKKSGRNHIVILNDLAWDVINKQRGKDETYVFAYINPRYAKTPNRIGKIYNNAWKAARERANLKGVRVHDLRHTYGQRLRAVGVDKENRDSLLGHANKSMSSHYAAPDLKRLLEFSNKTLDPNAYATIVTII